MKTRQLPSIYGNSNCKSGWKIYGELYCLHGYLLMFLVTGPCVQTDFSTGFHKCRCWVNLVSTPFHVNLLGWMIRGIIPFLFGSMCTKSPKRTETEMSQFKNVLKSTNRSNRITPNQSNSVQLAGNTRCSESNLMSIITFCTKKS